MPLQNASSGRPLRLLRALLREASYLPDAVARSYFRRYIVNRFKAYHPRGHAATTFAVRALEHSRYGSLKRRKASIIHERTGPLLKKAQKGLNFLRRANCGELPCLTKVLCFAYGRLGRRRYVLLADLLRPESMRDEEPRLTPLQQLYYSDKRFLQYFAAPEVTSKTSHTIHISPRFARLQAVIKSQHERGVSLTRPLKKAELVMPMHNIWGRPMPIRRARNIVKKWYAETMTKLLPPLPSSLWDDVRAMRDGEKKASLVPRRTRAASLDNPSRKNEQRSLELLQAGLAMDRPSRADKPAGMQRPHTITPRFMRRLYGRMLTICCKLDYDEDKNRWQAIWGDAAKSINPKLYNVPVDESLFAGVDASGLVPKSKSPKTAEAKQDVMPRNAQNAHTHFPFFTEFLPDGHPLKRDLYEWKRKRAAAETVASGQQRTALSCPP